MTGTARSIGLGLLLTIQVGLKADDGRTATFEKLRNAYPSMVLALSGDRVVLGGGTSLPWTTSETSNGKRSRSEILDNPSIADQMEQEYLAVGPGLPPLPGHDPGRARNTAFFSALYGATADEVRKNLVTVTWLAETKRIPLQFNGSHGAAAALTAVSAELDRHPDLRRWVDRPAGTWLWRKIAGTDRLSPHAWGIAMDINADQADYWLWDGWGKDSLIPYRNRIPLELVGIFERHGFIWGGRWCHYDTMHFEYRPELLTGLDERASSHKPCSATLKK